MKVLFLRVLLCLSPRPSFVQMVQCAVREVLIYFDFFGGWLFCFFVLFVICSCRAVGCYTLIKKKKLKILSSTFKFRNE